MSATRVRPIMIALLAATAVAACGDDAPKGKASAPAPVSASPAAVTPSAVTAQAQSTADPLGPRYEATLAEGIDFRKPGYPTFVAEANGISAVESWGRWTDGALARLRFTKPLPASFVLAIEAGAIGPNFGKPVTVRVGSAEQTFTVDATEPGTPPGRAKFTLKFEAASGDSIEIIAPRPVRPVDMDPKSTDTRLLGIGLVTLSIR